MRARFTGTIPCDRFSRAANCAAADHVTGQFFRLFFAVNFVNTDSNPPHMF